MTALADTLQVSTTTVKNLVREARQQGYQIVSGNEGYWFTEDDRDKKAFVREMHKQAVSRLASAKHIKDTIEEYEGQERLPFMPDEVVIHDEEENHRAKA